MSYNNFIPAVWEKNIERDLERKLVFAEDCNRKYEGDVKKMGDTVRILGVGKPTITTTEDKDITLPDAETVEDTSVTMPIRHISYFNYQVGDIDKAQASGDIMATLNAESSQGVANEMDKYIATMALAREAVLHAKSAEEVSVDNALKLLDFAAQKLYENDVPADSKIVATVPPWYFMIFKEKYIQLDTNNSEMMKNGKAARYGNIIIKMSNNVAKSGTDSRIMVRTPKAIAFANPMTHVEAYRPEKKFADAVKGFVLYDAKIVRPKEMIVLNVKPKA